MILYNFLFLVIFLIITGMGFVSLRGIPWFSPVRLFLIFNGVMGSGILYALNFDEFADLTHGVIVLLSVGVYVLFSVIFCGRLRLKRRWLNNQGLNVVARGDVDFLFCCVLYIISGVAVFIYFNLVGYNVILSAIRDNLSAAEVKDLRLGAYAGADYFAPGYFNQFKNILFPISFFALSYSLRGRLRSHVSWLIVTIVLGIPVILGLMGTGQRAFLVGFVVAGLIFVAIVGSGAKIGVIRVVLSGVVFLFLFSISSFLLGRSEEFSLNDSLGALFVRIFNDNQQSAAIGFRYIFDFPVQYGGEWLTDILGVLPGEDFKGSDLPNRIHELIYGSYRGTAPVSLWGSVYHNWGWFGILIFPIVLVLIYIQVFVIFFSRGEVSILEVAAYSFMFYILASWVASGPMQMLNNGLAACVILIVGLRLLGRHRWRRLRWH